MVSIAFPLYQILAFSLVLSLIQYRFDFDSRYWSSNFKGGGEGYVLSKSSGVNDLTRKRERSHRPLSSSPFVAGAVGESLDVVEPLVPRFALIVASLVLTLHRGSYKRPDRGLFSRIWL